MGNILRFLVANEQLDDKIARMDQANSEVIEIVREMIKMDVPNILLQGPRSNDPATMEFQRQNATITANAMCDLLCIKYHNDAKKLVPGYTLTYEELCQKV